MDAHKIRRVVSGFYVVYIKLEARRRDDGKKYKFHREGELFFFRVLGRCGIDLKPGPNLF